jgi:hypothetical protein
MFASGKTLLAMPEPVSKNVYEKVSHSFLTDSDCNEHIQHPRDHYALPIPHVAPFVTTETRKTQRMGIALIATVSREIARL